MSGMDEGCCICADETAEEDNLLIYCDGPECNIAVHQECYGVKEIPADQWLCCKCQQNAKDAKCCLCPMDYGALMRTDKDGWAHVICAVFIPGLPFADDRNRCEPIYVSCIPEGKFQLTCYICEGNGQMADASYGACISCNKRPCPKSFHVTCGQKLGLLCKKTEPGKTTYLGFCEFHCKDVEESRKLKKIPPFRRVQSTLTAGVEVLRSDSGPTGRGLVPVSPHDAGLEVAIMTQGNGEARSMDQHRPMDIYRPGNDPNGDLSRAIVVYTGGQVSPSPPRLHVEGRIRRGALALGTAISSKLQRNLAIGSRCDWASGRKAMDDEGVLAVPELPQAAQAGHSKGGLRELLCGKPVARGTKTRKVLDPRTTSRQSTRGRGSVRVSKATSATSHRGKSSKNFLSSKAPSSHSSALVPYKPTSTRYKRVKRMSSTEPEQSDSDSMDAVFNLDSFGNKVNPNSLSLLATLADMVRNREAQLSALDGGLSDNNVHTSNALVPADYAFGQTSPSSSSSSSASQTNFESLLEMTWDLKALFPDVHARYLNTPELLSLLLRLKTETRNMETEVNFLTKKVEDLKVLNKRLCQPPDLSSFSTANSS